MSAVEHRTGPWLAKVWDRPRNGTRYCAARVNLDTYGQIEAACDERGGVFTFGSRKEAQRCAERLNARAEGSQP